MTIQIIKKCLESRMLGNLHVRFGVGVGVQLPGLHHTGTDPDHMIDIDVLYDGIYDLNKFHKEKGIPKFVRCDKGHAFLVSHFPSKGEFSPGVDENSPGQKIVFPGQ